MGPAAGAADLPAPWNDIRMRRFAALCQALDASTATGDKLAALQCYFAQAPAEDAAWAVHLLAGGKPGQAVPPALLRRTACAAAGIDDWLFEACHQAVGDLAAPHHRRAAGAAPRDGPGAVAACTAAILNNLRQRIMVCHDARIEG